MNIVDTELYSSEASTKQNAPPRGFTSDSFGFPQPMRAWYLHKDYITWRPLKLSLNGLKNIATSQSNISVAFCEERVSFPTSQKNSLFELFSKHKMKVLLYKFLDNKALTVSA